MKYAAENTYNYCCLTCELVSTRRSIFGFYFYHCLTDVPEFMEKLVPLRKFLFRVNVFVAKFESVHFNLELMQMNQLNGPLSKAQLSGAKNCFCILFVKNCEIGDP